MNREEAQRQLDDSNSTQKRGSQEQRGTGCRLTQKAGGMGEVGWTIPVQLNEVTFRVSRVRS